MINGVLNMKDFLIALVITLFIITTEALAGGSIGGKNFNPSFLNDHKLESNCTNAVNKIENNSLTGLFCRLNGSNLHIYLALTDEALVELRQDKNASKNLASLKSVFVQNACKRNSYFDQSLVTTLQIHLVNKFKQEIADYEIKSSDCRR